MLIQGQGRSKSWILSLVAAHWAQCCLQFSQFSQLCNPHNSHHLPTPTSPKWIKLWIWVPAPFSPWQMSTELKQHLKSIWKLNTRFKHHNLQSSNIANQYRKLNHQVVPLAKVTYLATRWHYLHYCHIGLASWFITFVDCLQMCPQITCQRGGIKSMITFAPPFPTVSHNPSPCAFQCALKGRIYNIYIYIYIYDIY